MFHMVKDLDSRYTGILRYHQLLYIFDKAATNSFYGTPLHEHLSNNNVDHIVLVYSRR